MKLPRRTLGKIKNLWDHGLLPQPQPRPGSIAASLAAGGTQQRRDTISSIATTLASISEEDEHEHELRLSQQPTPVVYSGERRAEVEDFDEVKLGAPAIVGREIV